MPNDQNIGAGSSAGNITAWDDESASAAMEAGLTGQGNLAIYGGGPPTSTGGGPWYPGAGESGGGGGKQKFKWEDAYDVAGAPDWWKGLIHKGMKNEDKYGMMYNALLPFMSRADQNYSTSHLSRNYNKEKLWGTYTPANRGLDSEAPDITTADQRWMEGSERAQGMLSSLQAMAGATGKKFKEFGKGGEWLSTIAQTLKQYGALLTVLSDHDHLFYVYTTPYCYWFERLSGFELTILRLVFRPY
jgi:hypothetical protein